MDEKEILKLFDLLENLHSDKRCKRDSVTVSMWKTVLKAWSYPEVRGAVLERAKTTPYMPSISEVACLLPPVPAPVAETPVSIDPEHLRAWARLGRLYGVPDLYASLGDGMTMREWSALFKVKMIALVGEEPWRKKCEQP